MGYIFRISKSQSLTIPKVILLIHWIVILLQLLQPIKWFSSTMIMDTFQKYFKYERMMSLCGFRHVYLEGSIEDYEKIITKLDNLSKIGNFGSYTDRIKVIVKKFIESKKGNVDVKWWNQVMNITGKDMSGQTQKISGWFTHFFNKTGECEPGELKLKDLNVNVNVVDTVTHVKYIVKLMGGFQGAHQTVDGRIEPCMVVDVYKIKDTVKQVTDQDIKNHYDNINIRNEIADSVKKAKDEVYDIMEKANQ